MQSQNYKITEDSIESGKVPGAIETYQIKDEKTGLGLANSGQITARVMSLETFLVLLVVVGTLLFYFFKKLKTQKSKVNEYRA